MTDPMAVIAVDGTPIVMTVTGIRPRAGAIEITCTASYAPDHDPVTIPAGTHPVTIVGDDDTVCARFRSPFPTTNTVKPGDRPGAYATLTVTLPIRIHHPHEVTPTGPIAGVLVNADPPTTEH